MAKPFLVPNQVSTVFDNSGILVSQGAKLFNYSAGTTTKVNTYPTQTDALALTNVNTNPMIANSAGRFGACWATQALKQVVSPSTDSDPPVSPLYTTDNITSLAQTTVTQTKTTTYQVVASDRDSYIRADASGGPFTITLIPVATAGDGFRLRIQKIDSSNNAVTIQCNASEACNGNNTITLYNPYDLIDPCCDGIRWNQDGGFNVPKAFRQQFIGPKQAFAISAGTWTMTRNAQSNYSYAKTANAETAILAIDITNEININTGKGFGLQAIDIIHSIGTLALTTHTATIQKVSYANATAVLIGTALTTTGSLSTATQATPYLDTLTITSPAYNTTADSHFILEITLVAQASTVYNFYGVNLKFTRNDI